MKKLKDMPKDFWRLVAVLFCVFALIVLLSYVIVSDAHAQEDDPPMEIIKTLRWEAPTTREDGSSLNPNEIKGYNIKVIKPDHTSKWSTVPADTLEMQVTIDQMGRWQFEGTTVDTDGVKSKRAHIDYVVHPAPSMPTLIMEGVSR